jgi:hypothetical protein
MTVVDPGHPLRPARRAAAIAVAHFEENARPCSLFPDIPVKKKTASEKAEDEQWLAIRKEAGLKIDPETAEVDWNYGQTLDPYGVCDEWELPEEFHCVGREYFARSPGSDIWVEFGDLPEETRERLWARHSRKLAFPAGLEGLSEITNKDADVPF